MLLDKLRLQRGLIMELDLQLFLLKPRFGETYGKFSNFSKYDAVPLYIKVLVRNSLKELTWLSLTRIDLKKPSLITETPGMK